MSTENQKEIENKAIVERFQDEAWNKRNFSIMDELYSPEILYHGGSAEFHSLEELKSLANSFSTAFHDTRITVDMLIAEVDMVVSRFIFEGVHKGRFQDLPATGKKIKLTGIAILRLANGKIVEEWEIFDELSLMQQLGMELKKMEVVH